MPLAAFLLVQPLRYWAILSLGENWNTRVLVVPGGKLVRRGPYRYFPHPNYVVVAVEVLTFPLIFGAWITAVVFSLLNAALLYVRIRTEESGAEEIWQAKIEHVSNEPAARLRRAACQHFSQAVDSDRISSLERRLTEAIDRSPNEREMLKS